VVAPTPWPSDRIFVQAGGGVVLRLPYWWDMATKEVTVVAADDDGMIVTCEKPAATWESCRTVKARSLDELLTAILQVDVEGTGGAASWTTRATVDGEPAVVVRMAAPAHPANRAEVAYVAIMHDGRPYLLRMPAGSNHVTHVDDVIAGFRFAD
jgi:hypothetical protein